MPSHFTPVATFTKAPLAVLDFTINWATRLPAGDIVVSKSVVITPGGGDGGTLVNDLDTLDATGLLHTSWLSGGALGDAYYVTSRIVSEQGRADDQTVLVLIDKT